MDLNIYYELTIDGNGLQSEFILFLSGHEVLTEQRLTTTSSTDAVDLKSY